MNVINNEFGTVVEGPIEAVLWLEKTLECCTFEDGCHWHDENIMMERECTRLYVSTIEGCKPVQTRYLIESVCRMQEYFEIDKPWHLTWSEFCADNQHWSVCGSASVCYKGTVRQMQSPHLWILETEQILQEEERAQNQENASGGVD